MGNEIQHLSSQDIDSKISWAPLILASASPRRRELLSEARIPFEVVPADVDESPSEGEPPHLYASRVARDKATAISLNHPERWVLGADTVVAVGDQILGKPCSQEEACEMLHLLSGRQHEVITAVAFIRSIRTSPVTEMIEFIVISQVVFRVLTEREMLDYVETGEPMDKAGAYAIQGGAAGFIERYTGSWSNIVGLPMEEVLSHLRDLGIGPSPPR
jgi:septum formation protein